MSAAIASEGLFPETVARVETWAADPEVLGVLLVGSKSRGHTDARSDDDLEVLLSRAAFARLKPTECHALLIEGEGAARRVVYDAQLTSLGDLEGKLSRTPTSTTGPTSARAWYSPAIRGSRARCRRWAAWIRSSAARGSRTRRSTAGSRRGARSRRASAGSTRRWRCWWTAARGR
jgi:hypothetical protein